MADCNVGFAELVDTACPSLPRNPPYGPQPSSHKVRLAADCQSYQRSCVSCKDRPVAQRASFPPFEASGATIPPHLNQPVASLGGTGRGVAACGARGVSWGDLGALAARGWCLCTIRWLLGCVPPCSHGAHHCAVVKGHEGCVCGNQS